ncbi:hypothetical protein GGR55DRAFT_604429 [Xylaria sp. FL0064]|nr:hypothetical protein GGR55DRAFT_604429 [Xylaria sp. FL0064]
MRCTCLRDPTISATVLTVGTAMAWPSPGLGSIAPREALVLEEKIQSRSDGFGLHISVQRTKPACPRDTEYVHLLSYLAVLLHAGQRLQGRLSFASLREPEVPGAILSSYMASSYLNITSTSIHHIARAAQPGLWQGRDDAASRLLWPVLGCCSASNMLVLAASAPSITSRAQFACRGRV